MITRLRHRLLALITLLFCLRLVLAEDDGDRTRWITHVNEDQETVYLADNRKPSLYTGNFGDCRGGSTINVTRFDAAYYKDNMTVLFHLEGNTGVLNDNVMMVIGVYAYGENRFELVFNPCNANIYSMCPLNASLPIEASGIIPVSQEDVANIPPIALGIPDFEGEAILRIFSNSSRDEIACYSAVVTNGNSFSQPESVGTILGIFTLIAVIASFATAVYGEVVPTMRLHYAHSLSVSVVFAVWQHIFFSGALSVNWPSVLTAWWHNFAWAGGMIYSDSMQNSINRFIGNDVGNTSQVGAAQAGSPNSGVGGGFEPASIYKRAFPPSIRRAAEHPLARDFASSIYRRGYDSMLRRDALQKSVERTLQARDSSIADASDGYQWYGQPVVKGLPLPGNYSGFAGTLAEEGIAASNAFLTGFLWFLILLVLLTAAVMTFKWALEGLAKYKLIGQDRLRFFRDRWLGYSAVVALKTCYIGFFAMIFLSIFQFTYLSASGAQGIAAVVFSLFFIAMPLIAGYAYWYKEAITGSSSGRMHGHKMLGRVPIPTFGSKSSATAAAIEQTPTPQHAHAESKSSTMLLWRRMAHSGDITSPEDSSRSIHDDDNYIKKFGWLAARYRRTRWWFFLPWLFYEFLRAIFYGGASSYAHAQVFGLLVIEVIAFGLIIWMKPFEGQRLNILVVYCLGFSKITTTGLSAAFDLQFNLARIPTTVIGIVIIVIQGVLTIITMIAIVVGAISSYMSVTRNQEDFRPRKWYKVRERYFDHLDRTVNDLPRPPKEQKPKKPKTPSKPEEPKVGFELKNVKRAAKIEDEDKDFQTEMHVDGAAPWVSVDSLHGPYRSTAPTPFNRSRANSRAPSLASQSATNLPYGARAHRPSWSARDFQAAGFDSDGRTFSPVDMSETAVNEDPIISAGSLGQQRSTAPSRSVSMPLDKTLKSQPSTTSLRIGGETSTPETIGDVPAPKVRPRAGTMGSTRSRRSTFTDIPEANDCVDTDVPDVPDLPSATSSRPGSKRDSYQALAGPSNSRSQPLTPAQESEEFDDLAKANSRPH